MNPAPATAPAANDFANRQGCIVFRRASMTDTRNMRFFGALFPHFVPIAVKDIGGGNLAYTGCSMHFRPLAPGEKPPRYRLHVRWSSQKPDIWHCTFTEWPPEPRRGFFARLFGKRREKKETQA